MKKNRHVAQRKKTRTGGKARHVPAQPARQYKDRVFRMIFKDAGRALELYNALNGTDYTDPSELRVTTLEHTLYLGMKNDMSFVLRGWLPLYEHQSTKNSNMPLRNLFYVSRLYAKLTEDANLYSTALVQIPAPQFVVFYNGREELPGRSVLRLSDAYSPEVIHPELELETTVLNINPGHNEELLGKCRSLRDYMAFVNKARDYNKTMEFADAVERAIDECICEDILADFFRANRSEVASMSIFEYDEERHMQQEREEHFAAGLKEGREEGQREGRREGREEGQREGREEGEARLGFLISRLLSENRMADVRRASTDAIARKELYKEFGITK